MTHQREPLNFEFRPTCIRAQDNDHQGPLTRASRLLRKKELTADEANEPTEIISEMASSTVLDRIDTSNARLEAQFQSLREAQNTKLDAQNTKYNVLIWVIGFATVILSAVITLNSLLG
ncbi:MAG: hypothetical protein OXD43_01220 [Bacteroidetes bacterium]|nr:hypothetical protein [Bacteroidota bacterium]